MGWKIEEEVDMIMGILVLTFTGIVVIITSPLWILPYLVIKLYRWQKEAYRK